MRTRFAPSPNGYLHIGHALSAFFAYQKAGEQPQDFLLRIEDIDLSRAKPQFYDAIYEDLTWLGLHWHDDIYIQSKRFDIYQEFIKKLHLQNLLYPCFCTRKDILREMELIGLAPSNHEQAKQPYPGICRKLSQSDIDYKIANNQPYALRLNHKKALSLLAKTPVFYDIDQGKSAIDDFFLDDVILARKDIQVSYHIAVVIDDAAQQIDCVTRGMDLYDQTAIHVLLQNLLAFKTPIYHHHPLIMNEAQEKLSKRNGSKSLRDWRLSGATADEIKEIIASYL